MVKRTYNSGAQSFARIAVPSGQRTVVKVYAAEVVGDIMQAQFAVHAATTQIFFGALNFNAGTSTIYAASQTSGEITAHASFDGALPHFHVDNKKNMLWGVHIEKRVPTFFRMALDFTNRTTILTLPTGYYPEGLSAFCENSGEYYFVGAGDQIVNVDVVSATVAYSAAFRESLASLQLDCHATPLVGYGIVQRDSPIFVQLEMGKTIVPKTLANFSQSITDAAVTSWLDIKSAKFIQVVISSDGHPFLATISLPTTNHPATVDVHAVQYAPLSLFGSV